MATEYKVVEVTAKQQPRATSFPSVDSKDIEGELNKWSKDGWELFTVLERTVDTIKNSPPPQDSFRFSSVTAVALIFKK